MKENRLENLNLINQTINISNDPTNIINSKIVHFKNTSKKNTNKQNIPKSSTKLNCLSRKSFLKLNNKLLTSSDESDEKDLNRLIVYKPYKQKTLGELIINFSKLNEHEFKKLLEVEQYDLCGYVFAKSNVILEKSSKKSI